MMPRTDPVHTCGHALHAQPPPCIVDLDAPRHLLARLPHERNTVPQALLRAGHSHLTVVLTGWVWLVWSCCGGIRQTQPAVPHATRNVAHLNCRAVATADRRTDNTAYTLPARRTLRMLLVPSGRMDSSNAADRGSVLFNLDQLLPRYAFATLVNSPVF